MKRASSPVETEVGPFYSEGSDIGWVADLAGVIVPTQTELIDLKLLRPRPKWNAGREAQDAWRVEYKAADRMMTCLVEVKTSRADFIGDRKWTLTPPADLAYLAVPTFLIQQNEWPEGWGILSYSDNGTIRRYRAPTPRITNTAKQLEVVLGIAIRRDHHTRYARIREFQREQRLLEGEDKTIRRASDIARAFLQIAHGEHNSVKEVLDRNRIKRLPSYVLEKLDELWGVMNRTAEGTI